MFHILGASTHVDCQLVFCTPLLQAHDGMKVCLKVLQQKAYFIVSVTNTVIVSVAASWTVIAAAMDGWRCCCQLHRNTLRTAGRKLAAVGAMLWCSAVTAAAWHLYKALHYHLCNTMHIRLAMVMYCSASMGIPA